MCTSANHKQVMPCYTTRSSSLFKSNTCIQNGDVRSIHSASKAKRILHRPLHLLHRETNLNLRPYSRLSLIHLTSPLNTHPKLTFRTRYLPSASTYLPYHQRNPTPLTDARSPTRAAGFRADGRGVWWMWDVALGCGVWVE